jgi:hypothetical protein
MRKMAALAILLVITLSLSNNTYAQSSNSTLPNDLLYSIGSAGNEALLFNSFAWTDAQTLQSTEFFTDETSEASEMRALSWSPNGNYLAFIKHGGGFTVEVCILTRSGILRLCFSDLTMYSASTLGENYLVTWSENEESIYLLWDEGFVRHLIEVDIATGEIHRTIYEHPETQGRELPWIYWTPDADYVAIYENDRGIRIGYRSVENRQRDVTILHPATNESFVMPTELPNLGMVLFCDYFSPGGHYLVAQTYTDPQQPAFAVFDLQGNVISTVPYSTMQEYGLTWTYCPSWQFDEEAFYFLAGTIDEDQTSSSDTISIFKYTLADNTLHLTSQIYPIEDLTEGLPIPPLVTSPDGTHIAFSMINNEPYSHEVAVVSPTGELIRFNESLPQSFYPLWVPPVQTAP